jgi:hypothetical protein
MRVVDGCVICHPRDQKVRDRTSQLEVILSRCSRAPKGLGATSDGTYPVTH